MKYNGCPDSEVLAEYAKKFKYSPERKEEVLNKLHLNLNSSEEIIQKCEKLNKQAWRKPMVKYEFLKSNHDWDSVLTDSRASVNKEALNKEPSTAFKKKILLAEHSVIRNIIIRWKWIEMPYFVAMHFARHVFQKVISTQRNDRQDKYDRRKAPQDAPVTFTGTANTQNLIDAFRKRLCRQASVETRDYAIDFKARLHNIEPEISESLVPHCIYRGQCQEINNCGWYEAFLARHPEIDVHTTLQERYNIYNKEFYEKHPYIVETENNENG